MITFQQMATLAVCILVAGFGCQQAHTLALANSDEPQIIGIVFPSDQSPPLQVTQALQPQQLQLKLQRHQYQNYYQQQQQRQQQQLQQQGSEEYQPRLDSVKRTFLLKGLRPAQKVNGQKLSPYDDFVSNIWENTRSLRAPSVRARMQMGTAMGASGAPYQQYSGFLDGIGGSSAYSTQAARDSGSGRNYNPQLQPQPQSQQPPYQHHHRAGTEEIALHMPIHSQSTSDYGWKRVETNSNWNRLRGMWGKRAFATSDDNNNNINNNNNNNNISTNNHEHDHNKLEEKFKQELETAA